jgi:crotonobetainyl-CoA:carnitine CoA-transferase CaiB-like acyl-CoA transferase
MHNWAPGKAAQLRLDVDDLAACNPGLVYAHASGWGAALGSDPPFGTEYLVQAHSGLGDAVRARDEPPAPSPVTVTDVLGALVAAEGILAGLVLRERSGGRGCRVDSSLWSAALALQAHHLAAGVTGDAAGKAGRPGWGLLDRPLETADGYLQLDADQGRDRLADLCGARCEGGRERTDRLIAARIATRPTADWESLLAATGLAHAPVCTDLAALAADPSMRPFFDDVHDCRLPTAPWTFSP